MKFLINVICTLVCFGFLSAQEHHYAQLVTNTNDTLNVQIKTTAIFENNKIVALQEGVKAIYDNQQTDYTPKDLKSFRIKLGDKNLNFESVDGIFFAQPMYTTGKVKLYKTIQEFSAPLSSPYLLRVYLVKKPGDVKISKLIAKGLSRLVTREASLPVFEDCKKIYDKLDTNELKIKDEETLVKIIKEYEESCF